MLRLASQEATSANAGSVYPWALSTVLPAAGPEVGVDRASGGIWRFDPFSAYAAGLVTNPTALVLGAVGAGKSSLTKCLLARSVARAAEAGEPPRWVGVVDPKGEYAPLASRLGLAQVCLRPGGVALNPFGGGAEDGSRRAALALALAEAALSRPLAPTEAVALDHLAGRLRPAEGLPHLLAHLADPTSELAGRLLLSLAEARSALHDLAVSLSRLASGSLSGMLDGEGPALLGQGPGAVVDISAVLGQECQAPVTAAVVAWLAGTVRPGRRHHLVVDEAWALLSVPAVVAWLQSAIKLSRTLALAVTLVTHQAPDLAAQSDAHSSTRARAEGLLSMVEVLVVARQEPAQGPALAALGLSPTEVALAHTLPRGRALWRVGSHRGLVDHVLTDSEAALVDTDSAMRGQR